MHRLFYMPETGGGSGPKCHWSSSQGLSPWVTDGDFLLMSSSHGRPLCVCVFFLKGPFNQIKDPL